MAKLQSAGSVPGKETVYVDVDDEITAIIDKVRSAKGKVIALVLPKRAAVLQSIVNMKLLKRTAETADKHLVLVTSEAGLMPLAGSVGLYVADSPSSKPVIPPAPAGPSDEPEDISEPLSITDASSDVAAEDFDSAVAADQPVGDLAAAGAGKIAERDIDEDISLANEAATPAAADAAASKPKKNKKLAVPNFDSFRKKLLLAGAGLVVLVALLIVALVVLPKATITVHTDSSTVSSNFNLALDTAAKTLNIGTATVPATAASQQKTASQSVPATGQQNNGQKASGQIIVTNCSGDEVDISAGTSFSASGHTFIGQNSVVVPDSNYYKDGSCKHDGRNTVNVTALHGGSDYNLPATSYSFSGSSSAVTAQGSAMSGGTDDITKVVSQSDIDNATNKLKTADSTAIKQQLTSDLQAKGLQAVQTTYQSGAPQVTTSNKAGDTADNVTVTTTTSYTMLGIERSDLQKLVDASVNSQIDKGKQIILDDGIANAVYTLQGNASATSATVATSIKSAVGPQINVAQLKTQLAGKKSGDVKSLIAQTPGVTSVDVHFSPFWVSSVPKKASKVTLTVDKPSTKQ